MNIKQKHSIESLLKDGPVTILFFENGNILLRVINREDLFNQTTLQAGSMQHILRHLQSEPPTAFELEAAIATIEEELMPVIPSLPEHRSLVTSESVINQIAGLSSGRDELRLEVTDVERLFNRLVDVAYGTPAKMLGVPESREFAAALLYLRELMHHAGFSYITLLRSA